MTQNGDGALPEELMQAFLQDQRLMLFDPKHDMGVSGDEILRLQIYFDDQRTARRQGRLLDRLVGAHIRAVAILEAEMVGMLASVLTPSEQIKYAAMFQTMTAHQRTLLMRDLLKPPRGSHWRALLNAIETEATFRNELAHGTWRFAELNEDREFEFGWFLELRKRGRMQVRKLTQSDFVEYGRRVEVLSTTVSCARLHSIRTHINLGHGGLLLDLVHAVKHDPRPRSNTRALWFKRIQKELFIPLT